MRLLSSKIFVCFTLLAGTLLITGCTKKARATRALENATRYFTAGQYDAAEVEYRNVLTLSPMDATAITQLGIIYHNEGRVSLALPYLLKSREQSPDNLEVRIKLGRTFMQLARASDAKAEASYVLKTDPSNEDAPILLAETSQRADEIKDARQRLAALPPATRDAAPALVALAILDLRENKPKTAVETLQRARTSGPKFAPVYLATGLARWSQNDLAGAETEFLAASKLMPPRSPSVLQPALFFLRTGKLNVARSLAEAITKATPDYLPAWLILAELALLEKKFPEAEAFVEKILARESNHPEAMLFKSRLKLAKNEPAQAIAELQKMVKVYPNAPVAHYQLGVAYLAAGDTTQAAVSFNQALILAPGMVDANLALAGVNISKGDFRSGVLALRPIVQQRPDMIRAHFLLADAYRGLGSWNEALAIYANLQKNSLNNPQLFLLSGMVLVQQKKPVEARKAFDQALRLLPDFPPAVEQLVGLDIDEKQFAAAHQRLDEYIAKTPKAAALQLLKAKVYNAEKNLTAAEAALIKAIELQPDSTIAYALLARLYLERGDSAKALKRLEELAAKSPNDPATRMMLGTLYEQQKDFSSARGHYEKMMETNPKSGPALNNLAYLYSEVFHLGQKALEFAQRAKEQMPHEPRISDTLGWVLYKRGDFARSLPLFFDASSKLPDDPTVQYHFGMALYMSGEEQGAKSALQTALNLKLPPPDSEQAKQKLALLEIDPVSASGDSLQTLEKASATRADPVALTRLGAIHERAGALDKARVAYEAAMQASPNNVAAGIRLVGVYASQNERAKAMTLAKATRKLAPDDPDTAHALGRVALAAGDSPWAFSLLQEARRKLSDNPEVLFDFAEASFSMGQVAAAEEALRDLLKLDGAPRLGEARQFLALSQAGSNPKDAPLTTKLTVDTVLKQKPNWLPALVASAALAERTQAVESTIQDYERILRMAPEFSPARRRLALLYSSNSLNDKRTLELGIKARETFPTDPDLARAVGMAAYRLRDFSRAASLLQEAANQRAQDADVHFYLGMARYELKQTGQAKQSLEHALSLNRLNPEATGQAQKALAALK
jgi:tetratricopeptide (TPR) repeat protein